MIFRHRGKRANDAQGTTTAVLFSAPERRLTAMDVAVGPCVPLPGRKTAKASVHAQEGYETPEITAALYRVLTALDDTEVLTLISHTGEGRLYRFADRFVETMADASRRLVALIPEGPPPPSGKEDTTPFGLLRAEWDRAWMREADWPGEMVSTQNRLHRLGKARVAQEKGQPLYIWYGPRVPEYVVVSGTGPYHRHG